MAKMTRKDPRLRAYRLTNDCRAATNDAARPRIAEHETLILSEQDRAVFFDALVNPPQPNERLRKALREHERRVGP